MVMMRRNSPYPTLDAPRRFFRWRNYRVAYYVAGDGPAVLLVHSINAAASAFEMRGPFGGLRSGHRVFALDLLGYGGSDRPPIQYSAADYMALITDFAREVIGEPAAVVASSLGSAYVVRAAAAAPHLFGALALVCPTGIAQLAQPATPGASYQLLRGPLGDLLFDQLTSTVGIRFFLQRQAYFDPSIVDARVIEAFYSTCRAPGAKYAPICFITGLLNCDISAAFARLEQPVLVVWGKQATTTPPEQAQAFLARNPRARLEIIDRARLLVQDEQPDAFNRAVLAFFAQNPAATLPR